MTEVQPPKPKHEPVYSKHLQNYINQVIEQGSQSRKQLQQFISAFQKRIDAEISYAKGLEASSKVMEKFIQPKTQKAASYVCSAFKVSNQQRAHQARQLAESIKTQILDFANQMLKEHNTQAKRIEKAAKKLTKDFTFYEENLQRAQKNYKEINKETQQMIITKNIVKYTSELPQQKKIKLISKTMESLKEKREYENLYISAVSQYNQYLTLFIKQTTASLNMLQEHQQSRIRLQGDCIRKLIVAQISMFKNVEYDILNINKQMETIDPHKDIVIFTQQIKSKEENKDEAEKKLQHKILDIDNSMLAISLRKVQEQYFSWMLNLKKNKILKGTIEERWKMLSLYKPKEQQANGLDQIEQKQNDDCQNNTPQKESQIHILNSQQMSNKQQEGIRDQNVQDTTVQKTQESKSENKQEKQVNQQKNKPLEQASQQNRGSVDANKNSSQIYEVKSQLSDQNSNKQQKISQLTQKEKQMLALWIQVHQKEKLFNQPSLTGQTTPQNRPVQQIFYSFLQMTEIVAKYWVGSIEPTANKLKSSYHMKKLKKILKKGHILRILTQLFIQQYRVQHQVSILSEGLKPVSEIFALILDQCSKNDDAYVGRGLIGLLFTFNYLDGKNNKKLLYQQPSIVSSKLWKKLDFWDSAIFESTYEQMAVFSIQKGQTHSQTILREKNLIFSQLASYCHYMIMLGVSSKSVRVIVGRYCRLYEMNEDQNKDLSKMITNTFRQYKDMLAIGAIKG